MSSSLLQTKTDLSTLGTTVGDHTSKLALLRTDVDAAMAKAVAATRLPITPALARPGGSTYFPLLPNYVLADMQNLTNFAFGNRATSGLNGTIMFPFFCDRNVQVTGIKVPATTSGASSAKSYRFFIKNYDMATTTVLDHVYTGKPANIASTSTALKTVLVDNTMNGVLAAGKWYLVGMSVEGSADELSCSGVYSYPTTTAGYINAAGNFALGGTALFFAGAGHVTGGSPSNVLATPYTESRFAALSMDWQYTTAAPAAFTGGSGFSA
jgi:hypothetical protein